MSVPLPSIRMRLARALLGWSVGGSLLIALSVVGVALHEMTELLDDTLEASTGVLVDLLEPATLPLARHVTAGETGSRYAWQVVDARGEVLLRSAAAPDWPFQGRPVRGFSDVVGWRVYGRPLGHEGRMLYAAQTRAERHEARVSAALWSAVPALLLGLLGHLWLRERVGRELAPLQRLGDRLAQHEPLQAPSDLMPAEREELVPVHEAIDDLGHRLAQRLARERAFTAHAAHSLRTPLAGIDAQLAVALREAPPALRERLQRVRQAAGRLQRVVSVLLALFRSDATLQPRALRLGELREALVADGLTVQVEADAQVVGDPDLLLAALLNLLDNARRHGAHVVHVTCPRPGTVRLGDDGPGIPEPRRMQLQAALDAQAYEGQTGLGLMLADLVARSHGGRLQLLPGPGGCVVELTLRATC